MAVTLLANGSQAASLKLERAYVFEVLVDGRPVLPEQWFVYVGATLVASGLGQPLAFTPTQAVPHVVHVIVSNPQGGNPLEKVVTYAVTARPSGTATLTVRWAKAAYAEGDDLVGTVAWSDPEGMPVKVNSWTLRWNNKVVISGTGTSIHYRSSYHGLWRAEISGIDYSGTVIRGDATVFVTPTYERRDTVLPGPINGTLVYLGAVFSNEVRAEPGVATSLPYSVASSAQSARLLPGTTHVLYEIDTDFNTVDDEVVVRSHTGNYALRGILSGDVGYDYQPNTYLPAPVDLALRYTVDVFNVSGYAYGLNSFRLKIKCYRLTQALYRYSPCPSSFMPGGEGARTRRWGLLFTGIEAETNNQRLLYTTPEPGTMPLTSLTSSGLPDPYDALTQAFYTEANRYAIYEHASEAELDAKAICAVEGLRPFCFSVQHPANQPEFRTMVRLVGRMVVYVNGSALTNGSTVRVRIQTGAGESLYTVPVVQDIYNPEDDAFVYVGSVAIDLTDYQFDFNGVVAWVELDETTAVETAPTVVPNPAPGPDYVYAGTYSGTVAPTVVFDGACYGQPVKADTVEVEDASLASPLSSCSDPICGPTGVYCYESLCAPVECVCVTQPLYNPSAYVAYGTLPLRGYSSPKFVYEGAVAGDFIGVTGSLCGDGYLYNRCDVSDTAVVVYPCSTSPHPFVYYASNCYQLSGLVTTTGTSTVLPVAVVTPVSGCLDYLCTGSNANGNSYLYFDAQTDDKVSVKFEHLDVGIPLFGVVPSKLDLGSTLSDGMAMIRFTHTPRVSFLSVADVGTLTIDVGLAMLPKHVILYRGVSEFSYPLPIGSTSLSLSVQAGDRLMLDISKQGSFTKRLRNVSTVVRWAAAVPIPRLYDVAYGSVTGTYAVQALGFTGPQDRMPYEFYGTLPADVQSTYVNPDSLVTIKGVDVPTPEYVLVRCRSVGEVPPPTPVLAPYAGQSFTGQVQFSFYALRNAQASHGEMDVWFTTPGDFPDYLLAQPYRALKRDSRSYRKDSVATDATRNVYSASDSINGAALPNVYVAASDGQVISSKASTVSILRGTKSFSKVRVDSGIARNVVATNDIQITWAHLSDYGFDFPQRMDISGLIHGFNPDFLVSAGDNWQAGASNLFSSLDIKTGAYYEDFIYPYLGIYGPGAVEQRFIAGTGNHDHNPAGGGPILPGTDRLPTFLQYFNLAGVNYEVVKWPVHFFLIDDTEYAVGSLAEDGLTAQWLKAKLLASTARWKVVVLHYGPWCSGIGHPPYTLLRWPYRTWGADLLMSGHTHVYERVMFPDGLVAITCGTCNPAYWAEPVVANIWRPTPVPYSTYGYGIAPQEKATCRLTATTSRLQIDYINTVSTVLDTVTLVK